MQPIEMDGNNIARFKANKIVRYLLDRATDANIADLNKLAIIPFSTEDRVQFAQLIGYSVDGFGDLSYVPREIVEQADEVVADMLGNSGRE